MNQILVIYFSQSGQLEAIARTISRPFIESKEYEVTFHEIKMETPFPFPWSKASFFGAFPETFMQIPAPLKPVPEMVLSKKYDLVLFCYQVWYLSPSIPANSFLRSPEAQQLMSNTPVVTINGSRNMWVMAQEKVKKMLQSIHSPLKGNIALVDRAGNLVSVITIVRWMFSGVKRRYLGIFPLPGVSDADIEGSERFGRKIEEHFRSNKLDNLQSALVKDGAVRISSYLVSIDKTASKIFGKWANFIYNIKSGRENWLKLFNLYLFLAIWLISPIVYILYVFSSPFSYSNRKKEMLYYQGIN